PVALMEALATGVPVVASDLSGIPELVIPEQTGLLVPPGDAAALAAAIERLARDPRLAERLGAAGQAHIMREFLLEDNVSCLETLFVQALAERAPAPADPVAAPGQHEVAA